MKAIKKIRRAVWLVEVGLSVRWSRFQFRVLGFYFHRVTESVCVWLACGRPEEFRPVLPWWQPFVWRFICIMGWSSRVVSAGRALYSGRV